MKTLGKMALIAVAATSLTALTAYPDELELVQIPNAHGQYVSLYRRTQDKTVALFVGGNGLGQQAKAKRPELRPTQHNNAHGQTHILYREVPNRR